MNHPKVSTIAPTEAVVHRIERFVREIPGWSPVDELLALFTLVYSTAGLHGDVIEVGSWCGRSSVVLGLAADLAGGTKVHCIDIFPRKNDWHRNPNGTYSITSSIGDRTFKACVDQAVWAEPFERDIAPLYENHDEILDIFTAMVKRNGLDQVVVPHRGTSATFVVAAEPSLPCKFAFIDGDHSYRAVCEDIRNVERFLVPGGWMCFDDAFTGNNGIDQAISELILGGRNYDFGQQLTRKLFVARRKL